MATALRREKTTGTLKEHVENTGRSLRELDEKQKDVLCSTTSCAIKEGGLEDLEQKVRDPKEELGWTQRTVEGRWQDGNQLDRTILNFPLSYLPGF